jgi:hypothetical protein
VITVIVTIMTRTRMCMSSVNSYFDKNKRYICSISSYCDNNDNNGKVYV